MVSIETVPGNSSGSHLAPVVKLLLHTTEGTSIEGACAAYKTNNSWPHETIDCRPGHGYRICRHLGYDVAARSLRNLSGGVETNRAGVIQLEIVGTATNPAGIDWEWLGREIVGPICRQVGIPVQSSVAWVAYPASYGQNAPQRLSPNGWTNYKGILGHQHAPENDHGDPGLIPIELLLDAAALPDPEPDSSEDDDDMFVMYHPANTFWLVTDCGSFQISDDCYNRMVTAKIKAVAPQVADADAIIAGTGRLLDAVSPAADT